MYLLIDKDEAINLFFNYNNFDNDFCFYFFCNLQKRYFYKGV